jgi:hypothetical protein
MDATVIKAMLFDVDGVLVDGRSFSKHLAHDYNLTVDTTAPFFRAKFGDCLVGKADLKQELASYLPQWNWKRSVDEFLDYWINVKKCRPTKEVPGLFGFPFYRKSLPHSNCRETYAAHKASSSTAICTDAQYCYLHRH